MDSIETNELRLIGPDGKVSATFIAGNNHSINIGLGNPSNAGGISISVEENGDCIISLNSATLSNQILLAVNTKRNTSQISISTVKAHPAVALFASDGACTLDLQYEDSKDRLSLTVLADGQVSIQKVTSSGKSSFVSWIEDTPQPL